MTPAGWGGSERHSPASSPSTTARDRNTADPSGAVHWAVTRQARDRPGGRSAMAGAPAASGRRSSRPRGALRCSPASIACAPRASAATSIRDPGDAGFGRGPRPTEAARVQASMVGAADQSVTVPSSAMSPTAAASGQAQIRVVEWSAPAEHTTVTTRSGATTSATSSAAQRTSQPSSTSPTVSKVLSSSATASRTRPESGPGSSSTAAASAAGDNWSRRRVRSTGCGTARHPTERRSFHAMTICSLSFQWTHLARGRGPGVGVRGRRPPVIRSISRARRG